MSSLIEVLRAIIRDEIAARRPPELGIVTQVHPGDGDAGNHQADLRLRASGLELARVPVAVPRRGSMPRSLSSRRGPSSGSSS